MVVHKQLVEPAVCLSDLYDVFLLDLSEIQGKISGPCYLGHSDIQDSMRPLTV